MTRRLQHAKIVGFTVGLAWVAPCVCLGGPASAESQENIFDIFSEQEQVIVSGNRREQKASESVQRVEIISSDDIRRSGALYLPELLRRYAGVDVSQATESDFNVGVRGDFRVYGNDKILLLIDGSPLVAEMGKTHWTSIPIALADIERIEIVRGPGSMLYGANAFSGVFNIISKKPEALPPLEASVEGGMTAPRQSNKPILHLRAGHAASFFNHTYHLATDILLPQLLFGQAPPRERMTTGSSEIAYQYRFNEQRRISAGFQIAGQARSFVGSSADRSPTFEGGAQMFGNLRYSDGDLLGGAFNARLGWRRYTVRVREPVDPSVAYDEPKGNIMSINLETNFSKEIFRQNVLTTGVDLRYNAINWPLVVLPDGRYTLYGALFVNDEWAINEKLSLSAGVRGELQAYPAVAGIKPVFTPSPRAAIMYHLPYGQTLRLVGSQGVRPPLPLDALGAAGFTPNLLPGNRQLLPERIWALELSYVVNYWRLDAHASMYMNLYKNMRATVPTTPATVVNQFDAVGPGGEASAAVRVNDAWRVSANYTGQYFFDRLRTTPVAAGPAHKVNAAITGDVGKFLEVNLVAGYVSRSFYDLRMADSDPASRPVSVAPYGYCDVRVAYRSPINLDVWIAGTDLNRWNHPTIEFAGSAAVPIGARIMLGVTYVLGRPGFRWL